MPRIKLSTRILLFTIVLGIVLRTALAANKKSFSHDESISYLTASANQEAYEQTFRGSLPAGHWVPATEWKKFFVPSNPLAFRQIGQDLAKYDIHPPLYFWLLHVWVLMIGVNTWAGPTLNMLLFPVGALCLFGLAREMLKNEQEAAIVTIIWAISPAVLTMSAQARHYDLFGVSTIIFVWLVVRFVDPTRQVNWGIWLLLALGTAVGALTHYHFALVVAGAFLVFMGKLIRQDPRRLLKGTAAIGVGYLLMIALHPRFYLSFQSLAGRQELEARYLSTSLDIMRRLYAIADTFTGFWVYGRVLQVIVLIIGMTSIIWLGMYTLKNRARLAAHVRKSNLTGLTVLYFLAWMAGVNLLLYLAFITPVHAMEPRHMGAVWPFYAFLPVFLGRFMRKPRLNLLPLFGSIVLFSGIISATHTSYVNKQMPDNTAILAQADRILIDAVERGMAPRIFRYVLDDGLLYIAKQEEFVGQQSSWLTPLNVGDVYVSLLSYDNNKTRRAQILAALERDFEVVPVPGGIWDVGYIYLLQAQRNGE